MENNLSCCSQVPALHRVENQSEEINDGEGRAGPSSQDNLTFPLPFQSVSRSFLTYANITGKEILLELRGMLVCHEPGRECIEKGIRSHF